jgi:peptidoglycan/xylan/chitin deacetylase (PgdA/CDA1 family)
MYHSISPQDDVRQHPYYVTNTTPDRFREQMSSLRAQGYRSASIPEVVSQLRNSTSRSDRLVAITFDDGFQDFQENAFGILEEYGFSATVFLATGHIGNRRLSLHGRPCLTRGEVQALYEAGIAFGSHTVTHPHLETLSREAVALELRKSGDDIQQMIGAEVNVFSYPYAFPARRAGISGWLDQELCSAGYDYGVTTLLGMARRSLSQLRLPRIPINSFDDPKLFNAKLEGAYNWLCWFQRTWKLMKRGRPA